MESVSIILNEDNFKTWRTEAMRKIKTKKLDMFIKKSNNGGMPLKFETPQDDGKISQEYKNWKRSDQLLFRWILSSLSQNLRLQLEPDSHHSFQLWNKIETHFSLEIECEELLKQMQSLKRQKYRLRDRIKRTFESCQKICEENDALEKELVEKYGAESIADLLAMRPAK